MIMFTWWGGGQTRKDRPRDTDPRDIMLMYNMPTNIGFCEGESPTSKAAKQHFVLSFFFCSDHLAPWGFPLPIVNLISIGNWSRNEERYACPRLIIDYFLFFSLLHFFASQAQFFPGNNFCLVLLTPCDNLQWKMHNMLPQPRANLLWYA